MTARAFGGAPGSPAFPAGTQMAGDVVSFASAQREAIRNQLLAGKAKYEATLPPPTNAPISIDQIKARIPANDD